MINKHDIYADMEYGTAYLNEAQPNSQSENKSGNKLIIYLLVGLGLIIITAVGTYYWTRKRSKDKTKD